MKTHQPIICSYKNDFIWLPHCLRSIRRFATGYMPPVVCVDPGDKEEADAIVTACYPECIVVVTEGRPHQGFMRAQVAMMMSDLYCTADVLHFIGSDCLFYREFDVALYAATDGRPAVLMSQYAVMEDVHPGTVPWRSGVERVLGVRPNYEYMRRLPSVFPREVFAPMRNHVAAVHGMPFEEYIYRADIEQSGRSAPRDTSEANILGAFAHHFMPETCEFVDIAAAGMYGSQVNGWPSGMLQMWSHGGLDRAMEACVVLEDGTNTVGRTPREVIASVLYGGDVQAVK